MVLTAACLTCPILSGDQSMRLALMVPVPLAFVAAFVFCQRADADAAAPFMRGARWIVQRPIAALAAVALAVSAVGGPHGRLPEMVDAQGMADLRSWRAEMAPGDRAVVAARHGLEFWAAFAMDTHARWGTLKQEDFDGYDRFFILEERRGGRGGPPDDMGGPPGRGGPGGPWVRGGPGGPGGRGGRPGGGPANDPMSVAAVPREARIVKQSDRFTLWEVPASAREQFPTREQANNRAQQRPR
ncbi:MAG: hypothetical protein EBU31_12705 [Proteobacteria bacterium]|nr:hypothetical protein [Pseudomonadota bacterium]